MEAVTRIFERCARGCVSLQTNSWHDVPARVVPELDAFALFS